MEPPAEPDHGTLARIVVPAGARSMQGHRAGIASVRTITTACARMGVRSLTLYAFSVENWKRPRPEVGYLMRLLRIFLHRERRTLMDNDVRLRCIGRLEAVEPLVCDVARSAHRAARADSRFGPVEAHELPELELKISVLSPLAALPARSEAELLAALRPGMDGLVLREGHAGATFLPAVWESLPDPAAFLRELRRKAGLPPGHWSATLRFERYTALEF